MRPIMQGRRCARSIARRRIDLFPQYARGQRWGILRAVNEQRSRLLTVVAGLTGVGFVGTLDYMTGVEIRLFPLYFVPVAIVAWFMSRASSIALACASTLMWGASNLLGAPKYSSALVAPINFTAMLVAFGTIAVLVSELQRRLRIERDLSRKDPLTGLPNSRAFYEHGSLLLAVARRSARTLTLAYLDLDNFKAINDQFGHLEGDRALVETAHALQQQVRASDLVARLGGDEFAILMLDSDVEAARTSLERVRNHVTTRMQQNTWPVTVSVGAVTYARAPTSLDNAIHDADAVMYRAKSAGKNRVTIESNARA